MNGLYFSSPKFFGCKRPHSRALFLLERYASIKVNEMSERREGLWLTRPTTNLSMR